MKNSPGTPSSSEKRPAHAVSIFHFLFSIFFLVVGCGAPGEPVPPVPPVPEAVTDLVAKQAGDGVLLTFTMPGKSTLGDKLTQVPAFEVLRGTTRADGTPDPRSFRVVDTVPGALVSRYAQHGQVVFVDPIAPADSQLHSSLPIIYRLRTYISDKHPSPLSKDISIRLYPVPAAISALNATVTEQGVELKWPPPTRTSSGEPLAAVKEYRVYRGQLNPDSATLPAAERPQGAWKSPLQQLGVTTTPDYRDSGFDYGKTYAYVVRGVLDSPAGPLESSDSPEAVVTPKDTFPPAAPQGLVAAIEPSTTPGTAVVELSWAINVETDLVGYRVYRSNHEGDRGSLLNQQLLPSPAYRDNTVPSGQLYWYTVTAVDRFGNESVPSPAVAVDLAQPSR